MSANTAKKIPKILYIHISVFRKRGLIDLTRGNGYGSLASFLLDLVISSQNRVIQSTNLSEKIAINIPDKKTKENIIDIAIIDMVKIQLIFQ